MQNLLSNPCLRGIWGEENQSLCLFNCYLSHHFICIHKLVFRSHVNWIYKYYLSPSNFRVLMWFFFCIFQCTGSISPCKLMSCPKARSVPSLSTISSMPLRRLNIYSIIVYRQEATEVTSQACHGWHSSKRMLCCCFSVLWSIKYSGSPQPKLTLRQYPASVWESAAYPKACRSHTRFCVSTHFSLVYFWRMSLQRLRQPPLFLLPSLLS